MKRSLRRLVIPVVAAVFATGCSDSNPTSPPPAAPPPNLTGTWALSSLTQGGVTLTPPVAIGTFTMGQTGSSATEATGTLALDMTVPDGMGGVNNIVGAGTYTIRSNGSWEQSLPGQQATGTYALVGNTLTVTVTAPPVAASVSVWQKQ